MYKLSARHGVANMVFYGINWLNGDKKPPREVMMKFQNDYKKAVAKEATQHITVEQILRTFEENSITCMPLKGYLVKYLYPRPDIWLMAYVDILFRTEQAEQVKKLMQGLGFTVEHHEGNHDAY